MTTVPTTPTTPTTPSSNMAGGASISSTMAEDIFAPSIWDRWLPVWHVLFYSVLVLATVILLIDSHYPWWEYVAIFGISFLVAAWYACCIIVDQAYWGKHPAMTMGYLALGWMLWVGLIIPFPVYLLLLSGLYPQAFMLPRMPWKLIAGLILTLLCVWRQFVEIQAFSVIFLISLTLGIGGSILAVFVDAVIVQSHQRSRLIQELEVTRQELARAERQAGVIEERQRLAHEIHDTLAQGFTSIIMQLEVIEAVAIEDKAVLQQKLEQIRRIARDNLAEARRLMWALQPEVFDHASLPDVLADLTQHWSEESNVDARVVVTGTSQALLPEIEVILLRAAQEALSNVRKHAKAAQVIMTLSYMDDMVALDVEDDGAGFDPADILTTSPGQRSGGFGLKALRERVEQWDGMFSIDSTPAEGTILALALPALSNNGTSAHFVDEAIKEVEE